MGALGQETQQTIKDLAEKYGSKNIIVVLGGIDLESTDISVQTLVSGDPSYFGPLANVSLNLTVCHILEPEIKNLIPAEVYAKQIGDMELTMDTEKLSKIMEQWREKASASD